MDTGLDTSLLVDSSSYLDVKIPQNGSQYTRDCKITAAMLHFSYGNWVKIQALTGIPNQTLSDWSRQPWWTELIGRIRDDNRDILNAGYNRILKDSLQVIENKLKNSEDLRIMDVVKTHSFIFNSKQLLNNQPTSINSSVSSKDLDRLRALFDQQAGRVIDGTVVDT